MKIKYNRFAVVPVMCHDCHKQVIYQQEAETKEKEWGWKKDPYIYPRSFYSPVGYTPWDPWGRRL